MIKKINRKGQEEMVGFALIIIIVAVILLIFLRISITKPEKEAVESYEVQNFLLAGLQYTTDCRDAYEFRSIQNLIFDCNDEKDCEDGRKACDVLKSQLTEIIEKSWQIGQEEPVKAYEFKILSDEVEMLKIARGNITSNKRGAIVPLSRAGASIDIIFSVYY